MYPNPWSASADIDRHIKRKRQAAARSGVSTPRFQDIPRPPGSELLAPLAQGQSVASAVPTLYSQSQVHEEVNQDVLSELASATQEAIVLPMAPSSPQPMVPRPPVYAWPPPRLRPDSVDMLADPRTTTSRSGPDDALADTISVAVEPRPADAFNETLVTNIDSRPNDALADPHSVTINSRPSAHTYLGIFTNAVQAFEGEVESDTQSVIDQPFHDLILGSAIPTLPRGDPVALPPDSSHLDTADNQRATSSSASTPDSSITVLYHGNLATSPWATSSSRANLEDQLERRTSNSLFGSRTLRASATSIYPEEMSRDHRVLLITPYAQAHGDFIADTQVPIVTFDEQDTAQHEDETTSNPYAQSVTSRAPRLIHYNEEMTDNTLPLSAFIPDSQRTVYNTPVQRNTSAMHLRPTTPVTPTRLVIRTRDERYNSSHLNTSPVMRPGPNHVVEVVEINPRMRPSSDRPVFGTPGSSNGSPDPSPEPAQSRPRPSQSSRLPSLSPRTPTLTNNSAALPTSLRTSGRGSVLLLDVQHAEQINSEESLDSESPGDDFSYISSSHNGRSASTVQLARGQRTQMQTSSNDPFTQSFTPTSPVHQREDSDVVRQQIAQDAAIARKFTEGAPAPAPAVPATPESPILPPSFLPNFRPAHPLHLNPRLPSASLPTPGPSSRTQEWVLTTEGGPSKLAGPFEDPRTAFGVVCTREVAAAVGGLNTLRLARAPPLRPLVLAPVLCVLADDFRAALAQHQEGAAERLERAAVGAMNNWLRDMRFREMVRINAAAASASASASPLPSPGHAPAAPSEPRRSLLDKLRGRRALSAAQQQQRKQEREAELARVDPVAAMTEAGRRVFLEEAGVVTWARVVVTEAGLVAPELVAAWVAGLVGGAAAVSEHVLGFVMKAECRCAGMARSVDGRWVVVFVG